MHWIWRAVWCLFGWRLNPLLANLALEGTISSHHRLTLFAPGGSSNYKNSLLLLTAAAALSQNSQRLLLLLLLLLSLLLMLVMRIVLATVCYRFGSWGLVMKLNFCSDLEHMVWSRFCSWIFCEILKLKFGQYFAADVWLRLQSWILVKILNLGLMLNRDSKIDVWSRFVWNMWYELNPRVRCAFGNVCICVLLCFLNSFHHKLSEYVGYRGVWSLRAEIMIIR